VTQSASHRFLLVRLGALGDVIHGIPVAAALRERFPAARIDWMVHPRYAELLQHVTAVSAVVPVDLRRDGLRLLSLIRQLRGVDYMAAIDMQGLIKSAMLARSVGAWQTIGFPMPALRERPARLFYTDTPEPGEHPHVVYRNLSLLSPLGVRQVTPTFPLAVPDSEVAYDVRRLFGDRGYAMLTPGAGWPNKQWPPVRFGAVAASVRDACGLRSLVVWGPGEEGLAARVVETSRGAAEMAPPTRMLDLFGLARHARVAVGGDTGPMHIASAMGTPVVALFGPTRAERNGPWSAADIVVSRTADCACLYARRCRRAQPCIEEIAVDEVVVAVRRRIGAHA
jgi:heptosyltransferase I